MDECTWKGMKRQQLCPLSIFVFTPSCTDIFEITFQQADLLLMYLKNFETSKSFIAMHTTFRNLQFCIFKLIYQK